MALTPEAAEQAAEGDTKKSRLPSLYVQVLIAIAIGVLLGWLRPDLGVKMKPFGDGFVKLIKMLIAPIVFTTVSVGIASMRDLKKVGRVGGKAVLYFEIMTTAALLIGLAIAHLAQPGGGIHATVDKLDASSLDKTLSALVKVELGLDKGAAFNVEEYLKQPPDVKKGFGRFGELFRSHPYVPKRIQALRLFASSALYAQITGQDPTGKPSLPDIDKQVSDLISVF